jgi:CO/xanthine dehydrogenase FAD-binding subunit
MSRTELLTPCDRAELTAALARMTPDSRLLAGGTDLVRAMTKEHLRLDLLVDLAGLTELAVVRAEGGDLRVGAMATFSRLQADPLVRRHARCLADAAESVGSVQIRNLATIGGNVANASPCGDGIPALLALGAEAEIWDAAGATARRPVEGLVAGPGRTTLEPGQVIAAFVFPALDGGVRTAFAKVGSRTVMTVARLSVAVVAGYDPGSRTFTSARVALGAVGETAFRDEQVEASLAGHTADASTALAFAEACSEAVCRSIPGRYSLDYKCRAAVGLADDAWRALGFVSPADEGLPSAGPREG